MITKEMSIGQVLREHPQTAEIFLGMGMHCLGCPSATSESIEGAALTHGMQVDELIGKLNQNVQ
ncbi:MAG: DUF1858 domain-containing protein [Peptococcaceae bacterium]|jgi:hybrid cluster-associated redox disulfide protein|nr:DUF1858 domain-containing protein [Peptococcaceae bacterium]